MDVVDSLGLYDLRFSGLTRSQQDAAEQSMLRASKIAEKVRAEAFALLAKLPCPCPELEAELRKLAGAMTGVVKGVASPSEVLRVNQADLSKKYALMTMPFLWYNPILTFSTAKGTNWRDAKEGDLDSTVLHELSHLYGTEDDDSAGLFMNADTIERFADPAIGIERTALYKMLLANCIKAKNTK